MILVDVAIAVVACVGFVRGWLTGLFRQLAGMAGFIVGIWLASVWCVRLGDYLGGLTGVSQTLGRVVVFILIWVCVQLGLLLLSGLLSWLLEAMCLGFLNRLGGALTGAVKYTLALSVLLNVLDVVKVLPADGEVASSRLYAPVAGVTAPLFDRLCERGAAVVKAVCSSGDIDSD